MGIAISRAWLAVFMAFGTAAVLVSQATQSDTIFVHVQVTDAKKMPVVGLKAENFQIWDEGLEQKISSFSESGGQWEINLILLGPGGRSRRATVNEEIADEITAAASVFKKAGNPANRYSFDVLPDTVAGDQEFWLTIDRNLEELRKSTNPKRALIVVTAGFDDIFSPRADRHHVEDLNIPIYPIFLRFVAGESGLSSTNLSVNMLTKGNVLKDLVSKTRGDYFLVSPEKVEPQFLQLAADLKNDYVVGFRAPNGAKNNTWRKLKVKVKSPSGQNLVASTKDKYFLQKP